MMKVNCIQLTPELYFSYGQFFIYDRDLQNPACEWTEDHSRQGFARRKQAIAIGTLLEFGTAEITAHFDVPASFKGYQRVHAIPLEIASGRMGIEGPEEYPIDRHCDVGPGNYRIIVAQKVLGDDRLAVDIFVEASNAPAEKSEIIVADEGLDPPDELIETTGMPLDA